MKWHKTLIFFCISAVLMTSGCNIQKKTTENTPETVCEFTAQGEDLTELIKSSAESVILSENESYRLLTDNSGRFWVLSSVGQTVWSTSAEPNALPDGITDDSANSSAVLKYQAGISDDRTITSYEESVQREQYRVVKNGDKITVEQIMGRFTKNMLLPEALSEERFSQLIGEMEEFDAHFVERQYTLYEKASEDIIEKIPGIARQPLYVLMENSNEQRNQQIHEAFEAIGYTSKDLENDRSAAQISLSDQGEIFKFNFELTLTENQLKFNIPCKDMYNPVSAQVVSAELMKYGAFSKTGGDGYYFVPSGSGALFGFDTVKQTDYTLQYYGNDYAKGEKDSKTDYSGFPVFGMKLASGGYFAVIEEGAENVRMKIQSIDGGYILYPEIKVLERISASFGSGSDFYVSAPEPYKGNITIGYTFFEGENFGYSQMASSCREYLLKKGYLSSETVTGEAPFLMEVISSLFVSEKKAGIRTVSEQSVTSFAQTKVMAEAFKALPNVNLKLNGANKNGLFAQNPGSFDISKKSGGLKEYEILTAYCKQQGISIFQTVTFPFVFSARDISGYSRSKSTSRTINNKPALLHYLEKSIFTEQDDAYSIDVVSPSLYPDITAKYEKLSVLQSAGLAVGELSSAINSDFSKENFVSRNESKKITEQSMASMNKSFSLLGENPNDFTLPYISLIEKLPIGQKSNSFFEETVPFLPMVLHGYKEYTSDFWNNTSDRQEERLLAIESGSGVAYRFTQNLKKEMLSGAYSFLYNTDYALWYKTAAEDYNYVSKALSGLLGTPIKDHVYLSKGLSKVSYADNTVIYVNFTDAEVQSEGYTVAAKSYLRVQEI